jgi:large subunit ribosomal protein L25
MAHETPVVKVEVRDKTGTTYARRLRKSGRLPATIYSKGTDPISVSVNEIEILRYLHDGNHVMELDNGDGTPATVLVKDLQFGYLGDNLIHVDFARVDLKQVVTVTMTLELTGQPISATAAGAVLEVPRPQIEIECMVKDIPDSIKVDLTTVESVFTIGDLDLPDGVRAILDPERHIAHVTIVQEEVEQDVEAVEGEEATPEVISDSTEGSTEESTEGDG